MDSAAGARTTTDISSGEAEARMRVMRAEFVRPRDVARVADHFSSATDILKAGLRGLCAVPGMGRVRSAPVVDALEQEVTDRERELVERLGLVILSPGDDEYPELLGDEPSHPRYLWRRGRPLRPAAPRLAVVGTRRASEYGLRVTYDIAGSAAERGITIVSGLAFGIDRAAHEAALEAGGSTEAVLPCGPESVYPRRHRPLAKRILASGALLSEFPIGTKPLKHHFPRRNRIISGLAPVTIVVEAFERGGALITGRAAVEQGRHVFAVPGRIEDPGSAGTNGMLRDGEAQALVTPDEVIRYYEEAGHIEPASDRAPRKRALLSADDRAVLQAVGPGGKHIDGILASADVPESVLWTTLLTLERRGLLDELSGNRYRWSARMRRRMRRTGTASGGTDERR